MSTEWDRLSTFWKVAAVITCIVLPPLGIPLLLISLLSKTGLANASNAQYFEVACRKCGRPFWSPMGAKCLCQQCTSAKRRKGWLIALAILLILWLLGMAMRSGQLGPR